MPLAGLRRRIAGSRAGRRLPGLLTMKAFRSPYFEFVCSVYFLEVLSPKESFFGKRDGLPSPPPPLSPRPGFSDKKIFLIEAHLVFDLPHVTFRCRTLSRSEKASRSSARSFASLVHLVGFVCLFVYLSFHLYCICFPPQTLSSSFSLGNSDFFPSSFP